MRILYEFISKSPTGYGSTYVNIISWWGIILTFTLNFSKLDIFLI